MPAQIKFVLFAISVLFALGHFDYALAAPALSTSAASNVNATYATATANLSNLGGETITQSGFVWNSTNPTPVLVPVATPILQYNMNDNAANTTVADSSGNNNTGTAAENTSAITTTGVVGSGFNFNGTSDQITTTTQYSNPTIFSISAWFKTTVASGHNIVGFESSQTGGSGTYDRKIWIGTDGKVRFGATYGQTYLVSSTTLNDGNWHHAVGTYSSGTETLYIDGQLVGSAAINAPQSYSGYWRIGGYSAGSWTDASNGYFTGQMDDVRIYNVALSASDIALLYNNGVGTEAVSGTQSQLGSQSGTGTITGQIDGLLPNTTYYVQAYVVGSVSGTVYGGGCKVSPLPVPATTPGSAPLPPAGATGPTGAPAVRRP